MSATIIPKLDTEAVLKELFFYPKELNKLLQKHGYNAVFGKREQKAQDYTYKLICFAKNELKAKNTEGLQEALNALKIGDTSVLARKINDAACRKDVSIRQVAHSIYFNKEEQEEDILEELDTQKAQEMGVLEEKVKVKIMIKEGEISVKNRQMVWEF